MCVRSSKTFYGSFNLDMDRSPGFGSMISDSNVLLTLAFASAPDLKSLTLPLIITRRTVLQKVRRRTFVLRQLVNTGVQVLFHSPPGVLFTFPSQYWFTIGLLVVFSLTEWSPLIPTRFLVSRGTLDPALLLSISDTRLSRFLAGLPRPFSYQLQINYAVLTPKDKSSGLGSFPFARRYSGNRCFFLFLRVLRCFSSPGSLSYTMYSCMSTQGLLA